MMRENIKTRYRLNFGPILQEIIVDTENQKFDVVRKPVATMKHNINNVKYEINCFCGNNLITTKYYLMPDCCHRVFHIDCYLEFLWLQLKEKEMDRRFCMFCKNNKDVQLNLIDPKLLHYKEKFDMNKRSNESLYDIFYACSQYDHINRYVMNFRFGYHLTQ